jgi:prepilin-type N-terminal cleavage/methylation domain-containing protein
MQTRGVPAARGFTLIEIMVVVTIIAGLIAVGSLMVNKAMSKKSQQESQGRVNAIGLALEQLHAVDQLGRYPPTDISKIQIGAYSGKNLGQMNDKNVGAEALFVAFRLPNINVRPQGLDEATANTDDDKAQSTTGTQLQKEDLFEYVDTWGNPIVYLSAADYKDVTRVEQYVLGNGTAVKVVALKNETTGEYIRPDSFQLYSMGPDGQPGTDDDLVFGK